MRVTKGSYILMGGIILIVIILLLLHQAGDIGDGKEGVLQSQVFPSFTVLDIHGEEIVSRDFLHKYTFVQIGNLNREKDRTLLNKVETTYGDMLNILMIIDEPIISNEWESHKFIKFILTENSRLRVLFNAPKYGSCFLYNARGQLIGSGNAQAGFGQGMKSLLDWHLKKKRFEITMMIPKQDGYLSEYQWLGQFDKLKLSHPHNYYLFGLFSSICDSCSSGLLVNIMKRIRAQTDDGIGVWGILSPEYTPDDVICLSTQMSLNFPVSVADSQLGTKWNELGMIYTIDDISEILFVVNQAGKVIEVFSRYDLRLQEQFVSRCLKISMER